MSTSEPITLLVAPYAGAWIETGTWDDPYQMQVVAPYAGAWIETLAA